MSPNTQPESPSAGGPDFHAARGFFPTDPQCQLCTAHLSAPYPENLDQHDGEQSTVSHPATGF